jgi:FAD/FMN-containing dehydrogenase
VQDVEIPVGSTAAFLHWFLREVPITPVWLCPLRLRATGPADGTVAATDMAGIADLSGMAGMADVSDTVGIADLADTNVAPGLGGHRGQGPWPLYPLDPDETYVNVGFWSTVPIEPGGRDGDVNRRIEKAVAEHNGHKSLYSESYYPPEEFWALYGGTAYREVKARYDPGSRLLDLYAKAVGKR